MFAKIALALFALSSTTLAYSDNCDGSSRSPNLSECYVGIARIDVNAYYNDQQEFSQGSCFIKYATNGSGQQAVRGQVIKDKAEYILAHCGKSHGSYGTGNCDKCHVTVNYRS
ncbi:hypothetical protein J4E80_010147 [Alternaria sp. BMP 0032]|nr:hypothetical protein J4E80_010147 [Alternaria sp. BMP 0032]